MPAQRRWGTVNLYGVGTPDNQAFNGVNGNKEGWSPDRNQILRLSPDQIRYGKKSYDNPYDTENMSRHELIKMMLGKGHSRKEAHEYANGKTSGNITKAEVYRHKYSSSSFPSPFSSTVQESPY